jgi:hypothetical protein
MKKKKWYLIVVLIALITIVGTHMVHSQVVAVLEHEKMHIKHEISKEIEKQKVLKAIIDCESSNRHVVGTLAKVGIDIGKCQINTFWHGERAESMGLNLYDPADNMEYCLYLFKTEGVKPWRSSQACWQQELEQENIKF